MASILDTVWGTGPQRARRRPPAPDARPTPGGDARKLKRLTETERFGANPGSLRMLSYAPRDLAPGSALVVVLHGCTQNAEGYDLHAGWSTLADELGFALLYPEQRRRNNALGCFNWFQTADSARGLGEARSIREMIETLVARHGIDRGRIFVAGLSAGGAMTAVMLAAYPEVFTAGAIIAGLPCGSATSVGQAFEAMARPPAREDAELGDAVRAGAPYAGPWPRVSIWHGLEDRTVAPGNTELLVRQWIDVHGADATPVADEVDGDRRKRIWTREGRPVVEAVTIAGMGHGTPLGGAPGERPGPYMLDVGVSSTREIAAFFGLDARSAVRPQVEGEGRAAAAENGTPPARSGRARTASPAATSARRRSGAAPAAGTDHEPARPTSSAPLPAAEPIPAPPIAPADPRDDDSPGAPGADAMDHAEATDMARVASAAPLAVDPTAARAAPAAPAKPETAAPVRADRGGDAEHSGFDVRRTIEKALRAAGLMR